MKMINVINSFMIVFKGLLVQLNDYYGRYRRTCVLYFVIIGSVVAGNGHFADRETARVRFRWTIRKLRCLRPPRRSTASFFRRCT